MANLGDIVGAVISQVNRARCQADLVTVEIAQKYHQHPFLSTFPVPRFSLEEVVIDLKIAIAGTAAARHVMTSESRAMLLANLETYLAALPQTEPAVAALFSRLPDLRKSWPAGIPALIARIAPMNPINVEVDLESLSDGIAATVRAQISAAVLASAVGLARAADRKANADLVANLNVDIESRIREMIAGAVTQPATSGDDLDVLVTASELQSIAPERITTLRLSLHEADRSWAHVDTADGSGKDVLTPG
ncbi:MAG TPA: hypothetical protein VHI13_20035 [Candidatus Kapabacteria bacterium]|nr:hypothetical protein [Candidatus Kapabacteria bacterium]